MKRIKQWFTREDIITLFTNDEISLEEAHDKWAARTIVIVIVLVIITATLLAAIITT